MRDFALGILLIIFGAACTPSFRMPTTTAATQTSNATDSEEDVLSDGPVPIQLAMAQNATCVLFDDQTAKCFGGNTADQLGNPNSPPTTSDWVSPILEDEVTQISNINYIGGGSYSNFYFVTGDSTFATGENMQNQIGNGSNTESNFLQESTSIAQYNFEKIQSTNSHTCGLSNGILRCWGDNTSGQLLNGFSGPGDMFVVNTVGYGLQGHVVDFTVSPSYTCLVNDDGVLLCGGYHMGSIKSDGITYSISGPATVETPDGFFALSVESRDYFTCVIGNQAAVNGKLYCWGDPNGNRFLNGDSMQYVAEMVLVNDAVAKVAISRYSICALMLNKTVQCWGENQDYTLGLANTNSANTATEIPGLDNVDDLACSGSNCCAIQNNSVYCWGLNSLGQSLGDQSYYETPHLLDFGI